MPSRYLLFFFAFAMSTALARHSWEKPDSAWTEAEARQMITDSPWAKAAIVTGGEQPGKPDGAGKIIVRWEGAEPVRRALQRLGMDRAAGNIEQFYAVALSGTLPVPPVNGSGKNWTARLSVPGNWNLEAAEVRRISNSDGSVAIFLFPRQGPIRQPNRFGLPFGVVLPSWNAQFRVRAGTTEIVQNFPLDRMWYKSRIEL